MNLWVLLRPQDRGLEGLDRIPLEVRVSRGQHPADFQHQPSPDAILVCSQGRALLEPVWIMAEGVRWVHSRWAGIEGLLFPALVESGAIVTNGRGSFSDSLAEWAMAAVLFFAKDLRRLVRSQAEGRWEPFDPEEVAGRTLGIVGYGDIGHAAARRARAFEMKVIGLRRRPQPEPDELADEVWPLERRLELMQRADYVLVATPLTPETKALVGAAEIAAMKPTGVLINVGRGPCVDEAALVGALEAGRIRGAALDVFEKEPLPQGHPLYRLDNVLLSPHCADHVPGWLEDAMRLFLENVERFRSGRPLLNVVDKRAGY